MIAPVSRADFFTPSIAKRLAYVGVLAYLVYAAATLGLSFERVQQGIGHGVRFLVGFFPPNFTKPLTPVAYRTCTWLAFTAKRAKR